MNQQHGFLRGDPISPEAITGTETAADLIDRHFLAYNAARLREGCRLFVDRMLEPDVTVGVSLAGALTPAGLGMSALIPLIENGFIDWLVSTGANLYHDAHFAIGKTLHRGTPFVDDRLLRSEEVVRIYDVFFSYDVLLSTDAFFREVLRSDEFRGLMATSEFHHRLGRYVNERERLLGLSRRSLLAAAHRAALPVYTSSPGDSSIGMNLAEVSLRQETVVPDVRLDVNETASIVYDAKRRGGRSAVLILGGGSPKNFVLQTEPQIQEVLGISEAGHDYFLQFTDARPDTGGLSGATPAEAVTWGKIDPERLPDAVVCYLDATVALPLLASYALGRHAPRPPRRLYERREEMLAELRQAHAAAQAAKSRPEPK
jgi:deoxyhypusine synthase